MLVVDSVGGLHAAGMKSCKFAKFVGLAKKYRGGSATVIQALPKDERTAFQEENKDREFRSFMEANGWKTYNKEGKPH